ncbi:MAG: aldehyde dehydrogenase family protein, partial [Anaerolineae bacterium]|nr:aldehyde dehydrogenase family protein [Anaerolineae bacterium]
VTLELGGKSAAILCDDFDTDTAVRTLGAGFFGYLSGQVCHAPTRVIVPRARHDAVVAGLCAVARTMVLGDPFDPATTMGPLASARQRETVERYVTSGVAQGAHLACGGQRPAAPNSGFFFEPTVFGNVDPAMTIAQEEIFGPVLALLRARDYDDALDIANGTEYGLTGAVFSHDRARLEQARREFHVGNLYLNRKCTGALVGIHPFGGFNMSGTDSKTGGPDYLLLYTQAKSVAERL